MLKILLGIVIGGILAVTAPMAAEAFVALADWLPASVLELIRSAEDAVG